MVDVSAKDGFQIATGRNRALRGQRGIPDLGNAVTITFTVTFSKGTINLSAPTEIGAAADPVVNALVDPELGGNDAFDPGDIFVEAFDVEGRSLGAIDLAAVAADAVGAVGANAVVLTTHPEGNPGRSFLVRVDEAAIVNAYTVARGGTFEIHRVWFFMPRAVTKTDGSRLVINPTGNYGVKSVALDHVGKDFADAVGTAHAHFNKHSNVLTIDLVDDDEGNPMYSAITNNATVGGNR